MAGAVGVIGTAVDRREERIALRELQRSELVHRQTLSAISDAVFRTNAKGRFTFVCPNTQSIFGRDDHEIEALGDIGTLMGAGLMDHARGATDEVTNLRWDITDSAGRLRRLLVNIKPMPELDGEWLITCRDITDFMDAQQRFRMSTIKTVHVLAQALENRDPYVAGHQRRVADIAEAIGRRLGLEEERLEGLRLAAIVHDVGKINVPSEILNKPGRLSVHEFGIIKSRPEAGYDLLKDIEFEWPVADVVLQHHENLDGTGYPHGLSGDAILLEARILKVADMAEAITSHRPYRPGLGLEKAIEIITSERGTKSDPAVVDAFLDVVRSGELPPDTWSGHSY